jgi:hypothetical protein
LNKTVVKKADDAYRIQFTSDRNNTIMFDEYRDTDFIVLADILDCHRFYINDPEMFTDMFILHEKNGSVIIIFTFC